MSVTAHIASVPEREDSLYRVLKSLTQQVDQIFVSLNGYDHIPKWNDIQNVLYKMYNNEYGDATKFASINEVEGTALICDDDLVYTLNYADYMQRKMRQFRCPVSLHGKVYGNKPIQSFKRSPTERYHYLHTVIGDHMVDIVGTGVLAFDTSMVKLSLADFPTPNMADIYFAKLCKQQGVPLMVVEHSNNTVRYLHQSSTIWINTHDDSLQTKVLNSFL